MYCFCPPIWRQWCNMKMLYTAMVFWILIPFPFFFLSPVGSGDTIQVWAVWLFTTLLLVLVHNIFSDLFSGWIFDIQSPHNTWPYNRYKSVQQHSFHYMAKLISPFPLLSIPWTLPGHAVYVLQGALFDAPDSLFSGDLLFLGGCGRY